MEHSILWQKCKSSIKKLKTIIILFKNIENKHNRQNKMFKNSLILKNNNKLI